MDQEVREIIEKIKHHLKISLSLAEEIGNESISENIINVLQIVHDFDS